MNRDRFSGAGRLPRYLFSATKFLIFFALIAFVVTCSFLLFLDSTRLDPDILRENALLTFLNILLLSALFTVIDGIRRRLTVERPVRRIRAATQRIIQGDFSVRIEPLHGPERADAFDAIIEDFNQMARELSGVETLRTDFIANVSHELKTPLAVIQNYGSAAGPCPAERAARRICQGRHRCIPPPGGPDRQYSQTEQAGKSADLPAGGDLRSG